MNSNKIQLENFSKVGIKVVTSIPEDSDPQNTITIPIDDVDWRCRELGNTLKTFFTDPTKDAATWNVVEYNVVKNRNSRHLDGYTIQLIPAPRYAMRLKVCTIVNINWHTEFDKHKDAY